MSPGARLLEPERRGHGRAVTIWDLKAGRELRTIRPATDYFGFFSFDVSPDVSSIALGGWSERTCCGGSSAGRAWDSSTGDELWRIGHERDVNEVAFRPDGEHLATADWERVAKIVDRSGRVLRVLGGGEDFNFSDVAFSSDGHLVATAEFNNRGRERVRVWDWAGRDVLLTIDAEGPSAQVDFDPSGPRVVLSGSDGVAEQWDVESSERLAVLAGPPGGVNDLAFSPDGSRVATASVDGLVRLFDADTGALRLSLRGSGCAVEVWLSVRTV